MLDETGYHNTLFVRLLADESASVMPQRDGTPSKRGFGGVELLADPHGKAVADEPPEKISVPMDYAQEHHWIEVVGASYVTVPAGTAENPYSKPPHSFLQAEKLIFHTVSHGDVTYRVVRQPGKYDAAGNPTTVTGDPSTYVRWDYLAEREDGSDG
jgi:hypothetical protein